MPLQLTGMLDRMRRLNISLAAKCQLLFGAAVVIIIAAALWVPWQRMEQLTEQLNDAGAEAVVGTFLAQHMQGMGVPAVTSPSLPRLIGLHPKAGVYATTWERSVLDAIRKQPDSRHFSHKYTRRDGTEGYRYAQVVLLEHECLKCHSENGEAMIGPATLPAIIPLAKAATMPSRPAVLGIVTVDIPAQTRPGQILLNRVFLLTAGMLAGTLAIIVFYLITTRLILQPVRVLQETAEKVSQGDLNIRSDISTGDEFQQLSETFNLMLGNLKQNADQLRAINRSLDLKIGELAESNVALYESNRLKSEFLANVSHELRTPLNSILGFTELLKDSAGADARSGRFLANILLSGKHLLDLINDLLDLAKIEAGRMEVRSEPVSLNDLFEGLTSILRPLMEAKELTIQTTVATDVPIVHTDPHKLQQVLYNFLSNAIKFSPGGSKIELNAQRAGEEMIRINVTDFGPGIDPEKHEMIFEKFRQIDGSVTREHSGSGLGLAIAKELTTLLGGTIAVRSAVGEGATFSITLPQKIQSGVQDMRVRFMLT